jgi:parallel beta-helix repeat protein
MCDALCYPKLAWQQGASIDLPPLLDFGALLDGPNPLPQLLPIGNCLSGSLQWTISENCDWLSLDVNSGTSDAYDSNDVILTADINGLDYGFYSCDLTITDPNALNNPQTFPVTLHVCLHTLGEIFVPDEHPTIQQAIDTAGPNNIIMVDRGTHYDNIDFNGKNVKISSLYPDNWDIVASTIIDGNNQGPVITFESYEDPNCHLTGFTITDGNQPLEGGGICIYEDTSPTISNCIVAANKGTGIYCDRGQPIITRCIVAGNTAAGMQTFGKHSAAISNCTIVENGAEGVYSSFGKPTVTNSIIWANSIPSISVAPTVTFSNVEGGSDGLGNIDKDPCFVLPGLWVDINDPNIILEPNDPNAVWLQGDYHLKSQGWRWDAQRKVWTWDDITSPCIDAGNPGSPLGEELLSVPNDPNNEWGRNLRINMGAYGGTAEASMSPYD